VQLDRLGTVFVTRPLLDAGLFRPKAAIPVLMYHSVSDDPEPGVPPYYRLATSPKRFRQQMRWLHDNGFTVLDLSDAVRRLQRGGPCGDRLVVLTFDDGFQDVLINAWPAMAEFGFTARVFLPTAFIDDERRSFKGRACLTWREVRALSAQGISFGTHTVNHPTLYELPWSELQRELKESRGHLEGQLQLPVDSFAYPYAFPQEDGHFVARLKSELVAGGYRIAATTMVGRATPASDDFFLRRLPVNEADDEPLFLAKLLGGYDWVGGIQKLVRRAKKRSKH